MICATCPASDRRQWRNFGPTLQSVRRRMIQRKRIHDESRARKMTALRSEPESSLTNLDHRLDNTTLGLRVHRKHVDQVLKRAAMRDPGTRVETARFDETDDARE